jgi:hypothetical protein
MTGSAGDHRNGEITLEYERDFAILMIMPGSPACRLGTTMIANCVAGSSLSDAAASQATILLTRQAD